MTPRELLSRRDWLRLASVGASAGFLQSIALAAAAHPGRKRACILLWMAGGPSQIDTFDPKPGHKNGGPFKPIATATPGIHISESLPLVAKQTNRLAILRSLRSREGDHGRATAHLRTGYRPEGPIRFPSLGSLVSNECADPKADLPGFVSVTPIGVFAQPAASAGFLGPRHAPLVVSGWNTDLRVEDLESPSSITTARAEERTALLREMEAEFLASRPGGGTASHASAYGRAFRLQRRTAAQAFDLSEEKPALRDRYGRNLFGQGCLLARRLVERGVPFVEVTLDGWDTHDNNFEQVRSLCGTLDPAWATLMGDLEERGLLDSTLVVWMGEFGRTPGINPRNGRDHFPAAWSAVLGGGGIRGGQVVGKTSKDGLAVEDSPVAVNDLMATVCTALGLDPTKQNPSNVNRPIRLVEPTAKVVKEVLS